MQIEIKDGQSVYDLAIMYGYGIEGMTQFLADTGLNSIEQSLKGVKIQVTNQGTNLSNLINSQGIVLASDTRISAAVGGILTDGGFQILTNDGESLTTD